MKWLLIALACISVSAHAQKFYPTSFDVPAVLSYDHLMYLPDAKRIEYIRDVRLALAAVEASMMKNAKSRNRAELEMWRDEVQALLMKAGETVFPSAHAAGQVENPSAPVLIKPAVQVAAPAATAQSAQLAASQGCPNGYEMNMNSRICTRVLTVQVACKANETAVQSGGRTYCQLNTNNYKAPAPTIALPPESAAGTSARESVNIINRPLRPDALQELKANPPGAAPKLQTPAPENGPTVKKQEELDKARGYKIVEAPGTCKKREDAKNYHADAKSAYKAAGAPPQKYRNCIIGGMFSEYNNNEIKAGNCKSAQTFPPGDHASGSEKLKCDGKKAMCNPMLYCGPEKGKAHCFAVTQNLTKDCESKAKSKVECDPFKGDTMVQGARENWQEFAGDMNKLCGGDAAGKRFNEYFCEECKLLQERMKAIALKYAAYTKSMPAPVAPGTAPATPAAPVAPSAPASAVKEGIDI